MTSSAPLVSICLPSLNGLQFLEERISTIVAQTYPQWELIVSDSYSTDGAWEFFQKLAKRDRRVSLAQAPRGLYANFNGCVRRGSGDYIYIATSDDTMAPDCLESLVDALNQRQDCSLAHCPLRMVDEAGKELPEWWSRNSLFAASSGGLLTASHVRRAPFDGLLQLSGKTVYTSVTQLLIRRSLFDSIGFFEDSWGSVGDYNWELRAGLVANTVHVPNTWAGWRVHSGQATAQTDLDSQEHQHRVDHMVRHALDSVRPLLDPGLANLFERQWIPLSHELRYLWKGLESRSLFRRRLLLLKELARGSLAAREVVFSSLRRGKGWQRHMTWLAHRWAKAGGVDPALTPIQLGC